MNKAYKSIYNERTGTFVAVAENVQAKGKRSSSCRKAGGLAAAVVLASSALVMGSALADVTIDHDDESISFDGGNGTISGVSSITGLTGLQVAGSLSANAITLDGVDVGVRIAALSDDLHYFSVQSTVGETDGTGNYANDGATAENSVAIGPSSSAGSARSTAVGFNNNVAGT